MSRPAQIHIGRLVLPAADRHRAGAFRAALERGLAAEFAAGAAGASGDPRADRAARAVADKARRSGE